MNRVSVLCVATLLSVSASAAVASAHQGDDVSACASFTWAYTTATEADANIYIESIAPLGGRQNASAHQQVQPLAVLEAVDKAVEWAQDPSSELEGHLVLVQVDVITPRSDDPDMNGNRFTVQVNVDRCLQR